MGKWKKNYDSTRHYRPEWEYDFPWLHCLNGTVYCKWCKISFNTLRKSALYKHENTGKHETNKHLVADAEDNYEASTVAAVDHVPFTGRSKPANKPSKKKEKPIYLSTWESGRPWLTESNDGFCFCSLCNCLFKPRKAEVIKHEMSAKHLETIHEGAFEVKLENVKKLSTFSNAQVYKPIEPSMPDIADIVLSLSDERRDVHNVHTSTVACTAVSSVEVPYGQVIVDMNQYQAEAEADVDQYEATEDAAEVNYETQSQVVSHYRPPSEPEEKDEDVKRVINIVVRQFQKDLILYLRQNPKVIHKTVQVTDMTTGLERNLIVSRFLVGQMSQQYLSDYTINSLKYATSSITKNAYVTRLNQLEQAMEKSMTEMKRIKDEVWPEDEPKPTEETDEQEESCKSKVEVQQIKETKVQHEVVQESHDGELSITLANVDVDL